MPLPSQASIVIVGGGIAGCSTAYHLAALGEKDVLLLEQGKLTCGTTWHAAGLVGQMRPNRTMTRMSKYGIELYATLEAETGLATGWKQCGSVNVAQTRERLMVLQRRSSRWRAASASSARRSRRRAPASCSRCCAPTTSPARSGFPGDGKANPADLTHVARQGRAPARRADRRRRRGRRRDAARPRPSGPRVTGLRVRHDGAESEIACEIVVNCAGQWARQFGALAGVNVPLWSAEHFYIVTDRIEGVHPMLPVMRDPDGFIYYKEEVGGLVMGGFEPVAKPWTRRPDSVDLPVPAARRGLGPVRAADDGGDPSHAVPRDGAGEDAAERPRELHARRQLHPRRSARAAPLLRRRRLQLGRHRQLGRRRQADRRMDRRRRAAERPRRTSTSAASAPFTANRKLLAERTGETLGLHYAMRWPRQELETARPLRTSPLYDLLARQGRGVRREERLGARQLLPRRRRRPARPRRTRTRSARPAGWPTWSREQRATREAVALYDQTSFGKFLLQGRDALARAAAPVRQRDRRRRSAAWSTRRCSTSAAASRATSPITRLAAETLPDRHRLGAGDARRRLDRAPHARRARTPTLVDVERHDAPCSR